MTQKQKAKTTHISVQLPDERGKVIVLEVLRQKVAGELRRPPHNEAALPNLTSNRMKNTKSQSTRSWPATDKAEDWVAQAQNFSYLRPSELQETVSSVLESSTISNLWDHRRFVEKLVQ